MYIEQISLNKKTVEKSKTYTFDESFTGALK